MRRWFWLAMLAPALALAQAPSAPTPAAMYVSSNGTVAGPWDALMFAAGSQASPLAPTLNVGMYYSSTGTPEGPWYPCTLATCFGGGGGGGDTITSPNGTIAVGGTSSATTLDFNLAHANTWTALQTFNAALSATTGTFTDGTEGIVARPIVSSSGYGGLYAVGVTPSSTNFTLSSNAVNTYLNGSSSVALTVGASAVEACTSVICIVPVEISVASIVDSGITTTPSPAPICPNGTLGAFTTTGCATGGSPAFSAITTGINTTATMTVGAGATLTYASTGVLNANELLGGTWAIPGTIGSTTPNTGAFTTISGTSLSLGSSPPTACSAATGCWAASEGSTLATAASGVDTMQADSTSHHFIETLNNGARVYSPVVTALETAGQIWAWASNQIDPTPATSANVISLWTGTCSSSTYLNGAGACATPSGTGTVTQVAIAGTTNQINTAGTCTITTTGTCTLSFPVADFTVAVSSGSQAANSCSSATTQSVTNLTTGMVVQLGYSASPASLTGWGSTGGMVAQAWPSAAGTLSYILCNQTASSISYSAITFNGSAR